MEPKEQAEEIWNRVLEQPVGFNVLTDEPSVLHELLVETRKEMLNPELFQFTIQTKGNEVWIVRSKALPDVKVEGAYEPLEE
jgi:hypothetical protein